ncbi:hypothetical protein UlMin_014357 [Ulmus minor]
MAYSKGNGSGSSSRGRAYGMMLLVAFGAALLGVMILHKLRERRIFNLLIKDKDRQLFSLHLLLQKERDYVKEVKRKNEEMKAKIYSLRTQKMELDRRLIERHSTIDSLKDELKNMEAAIEEKQNEIRTLRLQDQMGTRDGGNNDPQAMALLESLKQKEAEIQDLKRGSAKIWSVSTDDPLNPPVNQTARIAADQKGETTKNGEKIKTGEDASANKTTNLGEGEATRSAENGNGNKGGQIDHRREMMDQQMERSDNLEQRNEKDESTKGEKSTNEDSKDGRSSSNVSEEASTANATEAVTQRSGKDMEPKMMDGKDSEIKGNGQPERPENSEVEDQENHSTAAGSMKLGRESYTRVRSTTGRKQGSASNVKGKRWRLVANNRRLENNIGKKNNGLANTRSIRSLNKDDQAGFKGRVGRASKGRVELLGDNQQMDRRKAVNPSEVKILDSSNSEGTEKKVENLDASYRREENGHKSVGERGISSSEEMQPNRNTRVKQREIPMEDGDQKPEIRNWEDQEAIGIPQDMNRRDNKGTTDDHKAKHPQAADEQESGKHTGAKDFFSKSAFDSEDKEEYKEVADNHESKHLLAADKQESVKHAGADDFFSKSATQLEDKEEYEEIDESEF